MSDNTPTTQATAERAEPSRGYLQRQLNRYDPRSMLVTGFLLVLSAIFMFPLYFMIVSSSFGVGEFFYFPPKLVPGQYFIDNYTTILAESTFPSALFNSIVFASVTMVGVLIVGTMCGYAFARFEFPGRDLIFYATIIFTLALPWQLVTIPLFDLLVTLGLVNTRLGGILPLFFYAVPFLIIKQNMEQSIVRDVLNSARIDGASEFQIFYHIVLPLAKPGIAAAGLIAFIRRFNSLYWPTIVFQVEELRVATQFIADLSGGGTEPTEWTMVMPAATLQTVPIIIMFLLLRKYFVKGLLTGSVKG